MTNKRAAEVLGMAAGWNGCGRATSGELEEAIHRASVVLEAPEWIDAKSKLPKNGEIVLAIASGKPCENITLKDAYVLAEYYTGEGWIVDEWPSWTEVVITHWMPLPTPPTEAPHE